MNSILYNPAETEPDILCMTTEPTTSEDIYSTTPLIAMHSMYRQSNEDELHSSFEEAISGRVYVLNKQLRRLSVPLIDHVPLQTSMQAQVEPLAKRIYVPLLRPCTRQVMLLITIAFMLIMVGFDLMGLLILIKF